MTQVITCPNCDKKLALRDELKGRALICPQCKGRFTVSASDPQATADFNTACDEMPSCHEAESSSSSHMAFLDGLGPAPAPATAKTAAKASASARPSTAKVTYSTVRSVPRAAANRSKKKPVHKKAIYVAAGAAVTFVAASMVAFVAFPIFVPPNGSGTKKADGVVRFGLTESQRQRLFEELFRAVDENGPTKQCRDEWRRLGRENNITDEQISAVLTEGMDLGWPQPAIAATMDQKQKTNRQEWIRVMNQTKRDPIMSP